MQALQGLRTRTVHGFYVHGSQVEPRTSLLFFFPKSTLTVSVAPKNMSSSSSKGLAAAAGMLRSRLKPSLRKRGGGEEGPSRWSSPGHQERPNGYLLNRTPLPPGQSRKWEDWELPYYITGFLTVVILGVGLNAKPDFTIETWAHQKALERLENQKIVVSAAATDESE